MSPLTSNTNSSLPTTSTFEERWQLTNPAVLHVNHIPLGHIPRAWERRQKPVIARKHARHRVGYPRADLVSIKSHAMTATSNSPRIATKKLRIDSSFGAGPSVSQWEAHTSPVRRIITRSNLSAKDKLIALADHDDSVEEQENVAGTTIEVLDEVGNAMPMLNDIDGEWTDEQEHPDEQEICAERVSTADTRTPQDLVPCALPSGFVSPAKTGQSRRRRSRGLSARTKRHSLPVTFAPVQVAASKDSRYSLGKDLVEQEESLCQRESSTSPCHKATDDNVKEEEVHSGVIVDDLDESNGAGDDWEDVVETTSLENETICGEPWDDARITHTSASITDEAVDLVAERQTVHKITEQLMTDRLFSSVNVLKADFESLPIRRSPRRLSRRASASPVKHNSERSWFNTNHLIAFTPVKQLHIPRDEDQPDADFNRVESSSDAECEQSISSNSERSLKPRISDDTALLQAFLERAAESKWSKNSTHQTTPIKRDSAEPDTTILAELDPNSPSPRKSPQNVSQDADSEPVARTRSVRLRKRPESLIDESHQDAPNRITIRAKTAGVELKKTEAQEIATVTRNNTRRNKGHALLPPLRLKKLAAEVTTDDVDPTTTPSDCRPQRRGITWAKNLVSFELLSSEDIANVTIESKKPEILETILDAIEKPDLTTEHGQPLGSVRPSSSDVSSLPVKKRKSRIATPAKGLGTASLLPDGVDTETKVEAPKVAPTNRRPASKLPAPTNYSFGQGKENSVLLSPAKKAVKSIPETRNMIPRFEFNPGTLEPYKIQATTAGLGSPAKKGSQKWLAASSDSTQSAMMSPAKRRTRRAAL